MTRDVITSGADIAMTTVMENVALHVDRFYDTAAFPLTAVGGTGNAVTATLSPALTAGWVLGMKVTVTWDAANSGAVTLAVNGGTAVPVLNASGAALSAGALVSGLRSLLEYDGAALRVLTPLASTAGVLPVAVATFDGTVSPPTVLTQLGLTLTPVRLAVGRYRFTLPSPRPTATFPCMGNAGGVGAGSNNVVKINAISTTQFDVETYDSGGAVNEDASVLTVAVY